MKDREQPRDKATKRSQSGVTSHASGASEYGATTPGSMFGGRSVEAVFLRAIARFARSIEAGAYRRLRDLDVNAPEPVGARGRPNRVRRAAEHGHQEPHPV